MYRSVPRMSPVRVRPGVALDLGQAEVGDPELALGVEQEVGRLDVAVEDAAGVGVVQRLGGLHAEPGHVADVGAVAGRGGRRRARRSRRGGSRCRRRIGVAASARRPSGGGRARRGPVRAAGAAGPPAQSWPARVDGRDRRPGPPAAASAGSRPSSRRSSAMTCGQAAALDELHGVEGHAPLAADGVDRDDVRVVQAGGGLGLELEPLQLPRVHRRGNRQDLQRHAAAERDLLGLVDDPHAAPADLADDAEIAQHARADLRCRFQGTDPARRLPMNGRDSPSTPAPARADVTAPRVRDNSPRSLTGPPPLRPGSWPSALRSNHPGPSHSHRSRSRPASRDSFMVVPLLHFSSSKLRSRSRARVWRPLAARSVIPSVGGDFRGRHLLKVTQHQDLAVPGRHRRQGGANSCRSSSRIRRRLGLVPEATRRSASRTRDSSGSSNPSGSSRPTLRFCTLMWARPFEQPLPGELSQPGIDRQRPAA